MTQTDLPQRLETIREIALEVLQNKDSLSVAAYEALLKIYKVASRTDELPDLALPPQADLKHVIISCDASIKKNPGGPASVGYVIEDKGATPRAFAKVTPATTINQAEYDAIYEGLTTFFATNNNPGCAVEIRSDSKLIISQLKNEMKCNDSELIKRRDLIQELVGQLPVPVLLIWRPRNSTRAMQEANFRAQDKLGVPRH